MSFEDFNDDDGCWSNGVSVSTFSGFDHFLEPLDKDIPEMYRSVSVPVTADFVTVVFLFFKIDNW